jgi:nucleoside-diphosphate-sugar epimerase
MSNWCKGSHKSDNSLYREKMNWEPSQPLKIGIEKTFNWIKTQL